MDIQALQVVNQLQQKTGEEYMRQLQHASIRATIENISLEGALSILEAFNYHGDTVYCRGMKWGACDLAVDKWFPECQGRMASETPIIHFWGGPPTRLGWYRGTLHTLLMDRVLYEINTRGLAEVAMMIGTDISF